MVAEAGLTEHLFGSKEVRWGNSCYTKLTWFLFGSATQNTITLSSQKIPLRFDGAGCLNRGLNNVTNLSISRHRRWP